MKTLLTLAVFAATACAGVQIPGDQMARYEASVRGAQEVGAADVPAGKLHLQLAADQTEAAKAMAARGDERAPLVLARAESDAELALGLAREAAVHREAVRSTEELNALRARGNP